MGIVSLSEEISVLKEQIGIDEVLSYYGAFFGRVLRGWGQWSSLNCPFCTDTNGSASMHVTAGLFFCHQCGAPDRPNGKAGDIVDVVKFGESITETKDAVRWIRDTFLR